MQLFLLVRASCLFYFCISFSFLTVPLGAAEKKEEEETKWDDDEGA